MLKIKTHIPLIRSTERRSASVMGVAWLNGDFRISIDGPGGAQFWSSPNLVRTREELERALREARESLALAGDKSALLLSHPQLAQTYLEVPAGTDGVIRQLVAREVERQKSFTGPAVWRDEPSAPHGSGHGRLLHLLPRALHDEITEAFRAVGLQVVSLMPASEAVCDLTPAKAGASEPPILMVVLIPGGIILKVLQGEGVLLVRTIPIPTFEPERIGSEIRRTISFIVQTFQTSVGRIRLLGPLGAVEAVARLGTSPGTVLEVQAGPGIDFWATWARTCGGPSRINLLSREYCEAPQRRAVSIWGQNIGLSSLGLATLLAVVLEFLRTEGITGHKQLEQERVQLEAAISGPREESERLRLQMNLVQAWEEAVRPPLHLWIPVYLAKSLPPGLILTNLNLSSQTTGWHLELAGCSTQEIDPQLNGDFALFLTKLSGPPLHLNVTAQEPTSPLNSSGPPVVSWRQRLQAPLAQSTIRRNGFRVEGILP